MNMTEKAIVGGFDAVHFKFFLQIRMINIESYQLFKAN